MKEENIKQVDQIMTALTQVIDPELQVDVVNLGLIYGIDIEGHQATVKMTLTISGCPLSDYLQKILKKQYYRLMVLINAKFNWSGTRFGHRSGCRMQLKSSWKC